jgi:hypothetical protein
MDPASTQLFSDFTQPTDLMTALLADFGDCTNSFVDTSWLQDNSLCEYQMGSIGTNQTPVQDIIDSESFDFSSLDAIFLGESYETTPI